MARTRDGGTAIEPGIVARIAQGLRYAATGRAPANGPDNDAWFGPLEPLAPMAPAEVAGRQFDYPTGYNLVIQPRSHEPVTFHQLRGLADAYDLLRLVIETRKDQIARLAWTIRPRTAASAAAPNPRADAIRDFLAYPDREHAWDAWLRMLLEDLLVIDAPTIYPRLDNAGRLYALEPVDGATIKRVLDDAGRTPVSPAPAYQQILKGLPAIDYAADELIYLPRNPRTNRVYGFSPVEQVTMTVNIALRRQLHQLQYYTEGTVPEALIGVPETWTPDQIAQFQSYWDALLADDTASRRHARFVPATISKSFVQTKDAVLKDDYDEWLARIVCYAFSVSAQWAIRQMNRATAETARQQAEDEGLALLLAWVKGALDRILRQCFAAPDLEFVWLVEQDDDTLAQAQTDQVYLQSGVKTVNEVRAAQGLAPVAGGEAPLVMAGNALVPLAQAAAGTPSPPAPLPLAGEGGPREPGEGAVAKYSPDQPRDNDGRWTDGNVAASTSANTNQPKPIQVADSGQFATDGIPAPATTKQWKPAWKDQPNADLRDYIANAEKPGADTLPNYGYTQTGDSTDDPALGRYQIRESNLIGLGLKAGGGSDGWGGTAFAQEYGIQTDDDFLNNEAAQEEAMTRYMANLDSTVDDLYAEYGGKTYTGISGQQITVTRAGLVAALHREGPTETRNYLDDFQGGDTKGKEGQMTPAFESIETRLRGAQYIYGTSISSDTSM